MMRLFSHIHRGLRWQLLVIFIVGMVVGAPMAVHAQDDGGDKKEKKEKPEKQPKEKPEKPAKEKPEKAAKEKPEKAAKEKPEKAKKEKPEKASKEKASKGDDVATDDDGGDDKKKKKKKKGKKGDDEEEGEDEEESADKGDGANSANESFHANNADSTTKHGRAVPCARYSRGGMEYIDKNNVHITIRRTAKREIHYNGNRGIREPKNRKLTRDQKIDKSKNKMRLDKEGKLKDKGNKLVFKIEWMSDCEYKLTFIRSKKPTKFKKGWDMDCQITKCYEDYYDCDCDIHGIIQYQSVRKQLTKSEIALQRQHEIEDSIAKDNALKAVEAEKARVAEEEAKVKAAQDEVFGPIKRIQGGNINESPTDPNGAGGDPNGGPGANSKTAAKPGADPTKKEPEPKPDKEEKEAKPGKEEKEPKAKGDKTPKEKTEKAPKEKKEKVPKEKKEKAPKEPKPKKEKAPKEPKPEKAPKEEKGDE